MLIYTVTSRRWCCIHALSILHFAKLSDTSLDKLSQLYQLYPQEKNQTTQLACNADVRKRAPKLGLKKNEDLMGDVLLTKA